MKQGDKIQAEISDYGVNGEGVAKVDGLVVFVPFAAKGEKVLFRVDHVKNNLAYATLLEVLSPSDARVKPPCNRFGRCGGCDLMHLCYDEQLRLKKQSLETTLKRVGGLEFPIDDCVPSDKQFGYRNKVQLPFGTVNGKVAVGFFKESTHKIVSITKCFLHENWLETLIGILLKFAEKQRLTAYDESTRKGLLRHLVARYLDEQLCVVLVINGKKIPCEDELINDLKSAFPRVSLYLSENVADTNVVMGKCLYKLIESPIEAEILGVRFAVNPLSFLQINPYIRDKIYTRATEGFFGYDAVIDVYSGIGLMGAILAKSGIKEIYNIEIIKEAVADANVLAKNNGIEKSVTNLCGDASELLPKLVADVSSTSANKRIGVIVDPPRKGLSPAVIAALNSLPKTVSLTYISCNPATLARDLKALDFTPTSITPYDMFPNTRHVETLVVLSHKIPDSHIAVKVDFDDKIDDISKENIKARAEARKPQARPTYKMIQAYVEEHYGFKVHTAYIAEVKRNLGLPMYDCPNAVDIRTHEPQHPTAQMVVAIKDALRQYAVI